MNPEAQAALARITEDEWKQIAVELSWYALGVSRHLRWRTRNPVELPGGETVGSIVSLAIEKVLKGERSWDPGTHPDLRKYLMDVIDSSLNHLATGADNTLLVSLRNEGLEDSSSSLTPDRPAPREEWLSRPAASPETLLLDRERASLEDRALELLIDECEDNPVLKKMLEAMFDGYEKPGEISEAKGIPVKEIYNAAKRLDRKCELIRRRVQQETAKPGIGREKL